MSHHSDLPFTFDSFRTGSDGLGFGGETVHESEGIQIDIEDFPGEVHIIIEQGTVTNISELPDKWVIKLAKPDGPPPLQAVAISSNKLGTNVLKHG